MKTSSWGWATLKYSGSKFSFALRFKGSIQEREQLILSNYIRQQLDTSFINAMKLLVAVSKGLHQDFIYKKSELTTLSQTIVLNLLSKL